MARRDISRRGSRDEPADEPTRGRSRSEEPDEAPRGRRSFRDRDPEPDDEPRGRGRRSSRDDSDSGDRGRGRDRDDEGDSPRRGRRSGSSEDREPRERGKSTTVGKGWGGYEKVKQADSEYVNTWKVPNKATLIKFMDDEPFSTYAQHWLDDRKGKKSFICLGDDCPLCDVLGDSPSGFALFNIIDMSNPDNPKVEVLQAGKKVANILKNYSEDDKTSPLNRDDLYWSIFRTGEKAGQYQTTVNPVKERDLDEDWDTDPFSDAELDDFEKDLKQESDVLYINSRRELKEIAESYE